MKYLLILLIALSFTACKDCTTCNYTIENDSGIQIEGDYSQDRDHDCEMSAAEYEEAKAAELQIDVDALNSLPTITSNGFEYDNSHYYTLECD